MVFLPPVRFAYEFQVKTSSSSTTISFSTGANM